MWGRVLKEVSGIAAGDESLPGSAVVPVLLGDKPPPTYSIRRSIAVTSLFCRSATQSLRDSVGGKPLPDRVAAWRAFGDMIPSSNPIIAHRQTSWLKRSYTVNFLSGKKKPLTRLVIRGFG